MFVSSYKILFLGSVRVALHNTQFEIKPVYGHAYTNCWPAGAVGKLKYLVTLRTVRKEKNGGDRCCLYSKRLIILICCYAVERQCSGVNVLRIIQLV